MASLERREREQAAVRSRILGAARDLFVREGYESVSLRRIAQAIDYTAPALYTHFASKEELLIELCRLEFGRFSQALVQLNRIPDPVMRLYKFGQAYIVFAVANPQPYRFMFMTPLPVDVEPTAEDLALMQNPEMDGYAALRATVAQAIALKRLRPEHTDPELIAQVLWSGVHGVASLQITHGADPCVDWRTLSERSESMLRPMLIGLLTPASARRFQEAISSGAADAGTGSDAEAAQVAASSGVEAAL